MNSGGDTVRHGKAEDLNAILEILNHYILNSHCTFDTRPFSPGDRLGWFKQFSSSGRYQLLVAERNNVVVGYAHSAPYKPKPGYDTTVETTVYVHPAHIGAGLGRLLLLRLIENLELGDVHRAVAMIALPNEASVALHLNQGFQHVGTLTEAGTKFGRFWDVDWYQYSFR